MAWDYPVFIVAMFVAAISLALWLMRIANNPNTDPSFACAVCGRKRRESLAAQWRYCPYCGAPKGAKHLSDMPRMRRSVLDVEPEDREL